MKKVIYIFHGNGDSFNMIFITIIQPKIHNMVFILSSFTSKYFFSGHNSKKQRHNFFQKQSHIFSQYLFRGSGTFLKGEVRVFGKSLR